MHYWINVLLSIIVVTSLRVIVAIRNYIRQNKINAIAYFVQNKVYYFVKWNVEPIKQSTNDKLGKQAAITVDNHIPLITWVTCTRITYCNYLFNYINHISVCEISVMTKHNGVRPYFCAIFCRLYPVPVLFIFSNHSVFYVCLYKMVSITFDSDEHLNNPLH